MPDPRPTASPTNRLLVKLRPATALRAAESRAKLRPLFDTPQATGAFAVGAEPQWFVAELAGGAATPWDLAHGRVADQLGVSESDILFAEPDLVHGIYRDPSEAPVEGVFEIGGAECGTQIEQDPTNGKAVGPPQFAWHLDDAHSQLRSARASVAFTEPRTRIAHLDTGYYASHVTRPTGIQKALERNFVERDGTPNSAEDPDNKVFLLDNSGHGTGTLSILAGGVAPAYSDAPVGGAPDAAIVPLRIADRVVLLRTSSFASALHYAVDIGCDVLSMSMGGLPARAWREEVDRAYLAGLCMVTAAGNNFGGLPTKHVVYPARYGRVIAACGVMADGQPYDGLTNREMQGCFGPKHAMKTALSTYTPNIPWAVYGCDTMMRLNGGGTSAATPQIAAAAALWFEKYKDQLPRDWRRVEAVRYALFSSAASAGNHRDKIGNGILRAASALDVRPRFGLPQTKSDNDSFAFLRVITGLGITGVPPREEMFNLELMQRWLLNPDLQKIVPDPEATERLSDAKLKSFMEAVIADEGASVTLRRQMAARYPVAAGTGVPPVKASPEIVPEAPQACEAQPALRNPPYRRLRVYAVDPSFSTRLDTAGINEVTLNVRWERLGNGLVGEYLAVDDFDPSGKHYDAVDLDDPRLLAQDGWAPSEGNAHFHQQMVYAVAMKTIGHFEHALGRPVLWRPRDKPRDPNDDSGFVGQLILRPHALSQANAFYSPQEIALKFGYFDAAPGVAGELVPGSRVYSCLSHDIIAHETTHAVLDGMHRRFSEPTNLDMLALHEGFADIVALMQHFTIPEVLESQIARTRGDIEAESMLGSLAVQFGWAVGGRSALRDAIGRVENGVWTRFAPDPAELQKRLAPHSRGAILVAAVFDAFIAIYKERTADLLRIYTGGTGVLPSGAIHPDLAHRLASEAAKSASHVLTMCIRALDYLPPVDVTFFEYLRALITADFDIVSNDDHNYRVAFVEAFRRRGIYPANLADPTDNTPRTLSVDTLRWRGVDQTDFSADAWRRIETQYGAVIEELRRFADACLYLDDREELFRRMREHRARLHSLLTTAFAEVPEFAQELGIDPESAFAVDELRRAMRVGPDGRYIPQIVVALTQAKEIPASRKTGTPAFTFRGGSTLVVDLSVPAVKYRVTKRIASQERQGRTAAFIRDVAADPLRALFFAPDRREPFAAMHALADDGV
jgi:hypothetical protein